MAEIDAGSADNSASVTHLRSQPSIQRRQRKDCLLSEGERNAIEPFKNRYKSEISKEKRIALVKSEILTTYFNYLNAQGQAPRTNDELKEKTKVR
jgi:hypothetical protein